MSCSVSDLSQHGSDLVTFFFFLHKLGICCDVMSVCKPCLCDLYLLACLHLQQKLTIISILHVTINKNETKDECLRLPALKINLHCLHPVAALMGEEMSLGNLSGLNVAV